MNTITGEKAIIKSGYQFLSAAVDRDGVKWFGTAGNGLFKYDGQTWTEYNISNSALPDNWVMAIAVDSLGNKWIGTSYGLTKFDGKNWTVYNTSNSDIPDNEIQSVGIDPQGNKWLGTLAHGLEEFREGGIIATGVKNVKSVKPGHFSLEQNYPNPFNPTTRISYSIPESHNVKITIYDMLGKEITSLVNEFQQAGNYTVQFDGSSLPSGIYIYTIQAGKFRDSKKLVLLK